MNPEKFTNEFLMSPQIEFILQNYSYVKEYIGKKYPEIITFKSKKKGSSKIERIALAHLYDFITTYLGTKDDSKKIEKTEKPQKKIGGSKNTSIEAITKDEPKINVSRTTRKKATTKSNKRKKYTPPEEDK